MGVKPKFLLSRDPADAGSLVWIPANYSAYRLTWPASRILSDRTAFWSGSLSKAKPIAPR
jgi:hypothetical protein